MSAKKMYPRCYHPWDLEPWYSQHVSAMTTEALHHKADIAEQLAWRDKLIDYLNGRVTQLETVLRALPLPQRPDHGDDGGSDWTLSPVTHSSNCGSDWRAASERAMVERDV